MHKTYDSCAREPLRLVWAFIRKPLYPVDSGSQWPIGQETIARTGPQILKICHNHIMDNGPVYEMAMAWSGTPWSTVYGGLQK